VCRLYGIVFGPEGESKSATEIAQIMAPALIRSGRHAYGWMANVEGEVWFDKHPGAPDTAAAYDNLGQVPNEGVRWLVGHNRWATHGSPEDNRNNHPLQHGNFIGVHNGVLRNHEEILEVTGREDPKTAVDSEAIFAALNKWGHRKGLRRIVGDMVAVYSNLQLPNTLHIARSNGRPLVYAFTKAGSFIFASEAQAIRKTGLEIDRMFNLTQNMLIRVKEGKVTERIQFAPIPKAKPKAKPIAPRMSDEEWQKTLTRLRSGGQRTSLESPHLRRSYEERKRRGELTAQDANGRFGDYDNTVGLYFYRGQYMSEKEYISQVMDDLNMDIK
jgi:glutamine phosphoribosylpyrophosphate amidotransferase